MFTNIELNTILIDNNFNNCKKKYLKKPFKNYGKEGLRRGNIVS